MKAIILAADNKVSIPDLGNVLRCLLPLPSGSTILERQVRTLNLCGFKSRDIVVVIGQQGPWEYSDVVKTVQEINPWVVTNPRNFETGSSFSLHVAFDAIGCDDVLILDGDLIFDTSILQQLLSAPYPNALLTRPALSISEPGSCVVIEGGRVIQAGCNVSRAKTFPWQLYCGIARVGEQTVPALGPSLSRHPQGDLLDAITDIASEHYFAAVDYTRLPSGEDGANEKPGDLVGGSYATLARRYIVRKETRGRGKLKLRNEIQWLTSLPEELKPYFPTVLDYYLGKDWVWYEMPYYRVPNLRKLLMVGDYSVEDAQDFLVRVLDFLFNHLYSRRLRVVTSDWVAAKHLNRVNHRLIQTIQMSSVLSRIIEARRIVINGVELRNLPDLILEIAQRPTLLASVNPSYLCMIHGDFHFQNMLVGPLENGVPFLLTDPRGELEGADLYYDIGKLFHSINGLYDFLHTDQFELELTFKGMDVDATFSISNQTVLETYRQLCSVMPDILTSFDQIRNDSNWLMKALFAEAMHFSSVMPFHIAGDGIDKRAVAMYLTAVRLLNEFWDRFDIVSWPEETSYINVNTLEDYQRVLRSASLSSQEFV